MAERDIPIVIRAIEDSIKQEPIEDGNNEEKKVSQFGKGV